MNATLTVPTGEPGGKKIRVSGAMPRDIERQADELGAVVIRFDHDPTPLVRISGEWTFIA
jgi:hypothetical protein